MHIRVRVPRSTAKLGRIFVALAMAKAGRKSLRFRQSRPGSCAGLCDNPEPERAPEIVEINLYSPADAASVLEEGRVAALGHAPVKLLRR